MAMVVPWPSSSGTAFKIATKLQARFLSAASAAQNGVASEVPRTEYVAGCSLQDLHNAAYQSELSLDKSLSTSLLPFIVRGAMSDGWPVQQWDSKALLDQCGDVTVPVEVSFRGADYRSLYSSSHRGQEELFHAGVPVPLSMLLDHMQQTEEQHMQVSCFSIYFHLLHVFCFVRCYMQVILCNHAGMCLKAAGTSRRQH